MSFEGQWITLKQPQITQIASIPDRDRTVFCFAVESDEIPAHQVKSAREALMKQVSRWEYGSFSNVGVHPFGAYGVHDSFYNGNFVRSVSVEADRVPDGGELTVVDAVAAVCEAAGIPFQPEKSREKAGNLIDRATGSLHAKEVMTEKVLLDLLNPAGLRFDMDAKGLYLYPARDAERTISTGVLHVPPSSEAAALLNTASDLYGQSSFEAAMEVHRKIYEDFPNWTYAANSMMMVGICQNRLGNRKEAIKALEAAVDRYPDILGFSEAIYRYLEGFYEEAGNQEAARSVREKFNKLADEGKLDRSRARW